MSGVVPEGSERAGRREMTNHGKTGRRTDAQVAVRARVEPVPSAAPAAKVPRPPPTPPRSRSAHTEGQIPRLVIHGTVLVLSITLFVGLLSADWVEVNPALQFQGEDLPQGLNLPDQWIAFDMGEVWDQSDSMSDKGRVVYPLIGLGGLMLVSFAGLVFSIVPATAGLRRIDATLATLAMGLATFGAIGPLRMLGNWLMTVLNGLEGLRQLWPIWATAVVLVTLVAALAVYLFRVQGVWAGGHARHRFAFVVVAATWMLFVLSPVVLLQSNEERSQNQAFDDSNIGNVADADGELSSAMSVLLFAKAIFGYALAGLAAMVLLEIWGGAAGATAVTRWSLGGLTALACLVATVLVVVSAVMVFAADDALPFMSFVWAVGLPVAGALTTWWVVREVRGGPAKRTTQPSIGTA